MKIAMVSEHANPLANPGSVDAGGQNVHVAALSQALADRGHEVTVYTRRDSQHAPERQMLSKNVEVVHVSAGPPTRVPKDEMLPMMGEFAESLRRYWDENPPDIVHSHFWMSGLAALGARTQSFEDQNTPPIVHTFHALGSVKRRFQGAEDTSPPAREWLEPEVGKQVDAIIATCKDEVSELRALGIPLEHIYVVPCGVDLDVFKKIGCQEAKGARFRMVSAGRLVPRKGVDIIIQALGILKRRGFKDFELEIVGTGETAGDDDPELVRLKDLAKELNVSDLIHFRGQIPREDIPALLRSADAVICTPWYEPFGIVPLESMACGTPVVVAAVGGLKNTVLNRITGLHVNPQSPESLVAALQEMILDHAFCIEMGGAGETLVQGKYGWATIASKTEAIYQQRLYIHNSLQDLEKVENS